MHAKSPQRPPHFSLADFCSRRCLAITLLVAGLLLGLARPAQPQHFTFRDYHQTDGLGNLSVTCLLQDRAQFVWMCTDNGLYRFDGVSFERLSDRAGIHSDAIGGVVEDATGSVWVSTPAELYRRVGDGFQPIRPDGRPLAVAAGSRLAVLPSGHMLAIDGSQLVELGTDAPGGAWHSKPYFSLQQLAATPALADLASVDVDHTGRLWLGCGNAICRVDHGEVDLFDTGAGVPEDSWRSWMLEADGRLWVRGMAHVAVLEPGAARFEVRDVPHGVLPAELSSAPLALDEQGRILTSNDVGLSRWQQDGWQDFARASGIPAPGITAILVTGDGQVWLGLHGHGLVRWLGYGNFESWTMAQGLGDPRVQSVARETEQSLLLGTRAGCYRLELATKFVSPCRILDLPRGEIQAITQGGGAVWIGMATGALFRVSATDQRATLVANLPPIRKLYADSTGRLWICTAAGVDLIELGTTYVESTPLPAEAADVSDVTQDAEGSTYLATKGGLLLWSHGRWIKLGVEGGQARAGFTSVAAAAGGELWAGSAAHGLLKVRVASGRVDRAQWVPDFMLERAKVTFTAADSRGWIWAGTDAGVVVFDGKAWRRFDFHDGLASNDTLANAFYADPRGSIWVGTSGGLTHVTNPEALVRVIPIDLRITRPLLGSKALDGDAPKRPWEPDTGLTLRLAQFNFGRTGLGYIRARLRGLDDTWHFTRSHDFSYPALGPGVYTFEATAFDPEHGQVSEVAHLSFEILPPWWQSTWFRALAATALLALIGAGGIWARRKWHAHQREIERQEVEREKLLERATRDSLTGLWNRAAILDILGREMKIAKKRGTPLAVAIIDIDHFKRINDTRGHLAGDAVLRTLGSKLVSRIRSSDALGRYGGEEFLLIAPGAPEQTPFLPLERLHRAIAEAPVAHEGLPIKVTASFGVAWFIAATDSTESLLGRADAALYTAKDAGRNRVEYAATG